MSSAFNFSSYSEAQFAFEAIGASAWKSLSKLTESRLAAMQLASSYLEYRAGSAGLAIPECETCKAISQHYDDIDEDAIYGFLGDLRRNTLLAAIGIFDSFLSDALRFLFLHWPNTLPQDVHEKIKSGETYPDYIERIIRRSRRFSSQSKRVEFLTSEFSVELDDTSLETLSRLTAQSTLVSLLTDSLMRGTRHVGKKMKQRSHNQRASADDKAAAYL